MKRIVTRQEAKDFKQDKYFTGEPCVNGNISERMTKSTLCDCPECRRHRSEQSKKSAAKRKVVRRKATFNPNQDPLWRLALGLPPLV